jgi:hypothetical protein
MAMHRLEDIVWMIFGACVSLTSLYMRLMRHAHLYFTDPRASWAPTWIVAAFGASLFTFALIRFARQTARSPVRRATKGSGRRGEGPRKNSFAMPGFQSRNLG